MSEILIVGPAGRIQARYHKGKGRNAPLAIVLHPHPEHGGTMNSKVTYALFRSFVDLGFSTLRFNFRGVGCSEGKFDHGDGEHVGGGDPHDIDVIRFDRFAPVGDGALESKVVHRAIASLFLGVCADNEFGIERAVREEGRDSQHGPTVRLPHPTQT